VAALVVAALALVTAARGRLVAAVEQGDYAADVVDRLVELKRAGARSRTRGGW
jgi:hypothetical protein